MLQQIFFDPFFGAENIWIDGSQSCVGWAELYHIWGGHGPVVDKITKFFSVFRYVASFGYADDSEITEVEK